MLHLKTTIALASTFMFAGSVLAATPMPAAGDAPYMGEMQTQPAPSNLTRTEVEAQAALEPPAAGQMNGYDVSNRAAAQAAPTSGRVRIDARNQPSSAELDAMSRTLTVGNLPVPGTLAPVGNATAASGASPAAQNAS